MFRGSITQVGEESPIFKPRAPAKTMYFSAKDLDHLRNTKTEGLKLDAKKVTEPP